MDIKKVYRALIFKLNKLGTNANQNISYPQFVYLINQAQLTWAEDRMKLVERTGVIQEELRQLLQVFKPASVSHTAEHTSFILPADYFHYARLSADVKGCSSKVYGKRVEEGNISALLTDAFTRPASAWEECLVTLFKNSLRVYTDALLENIELSYYRYPVQVDIEGYTKEDGTPSSNVDLEFDEADAYEIIDFAAMLAASDIGDGTRFQEKAQQTNRYT